MDGQEERVTSLNATDSVLLKSVDPGTRDSLSDSDGHLGFRLRVGRTVGALESHGVPWSVEGAAR